MSEELSLHFNGHFPGGPGLIGTRMFTTFWILLEIRVMEVILTTGAIRDTKLQSKWHRQQTIIQFFYKPDALPVAQPTVSKHRREKCLYNWLTEKDSCLKWSAKRDVKLYCISHSRPPPLFRLAASVVVLVIRKGGESSWSGPWHLRCALDVFHVHSYQDQFIQPSRAECVFFIHI